MVAKKGGGGRGAEDSVEELADSFTRNLSCTSAISTWSDNLNAESASQLSESQPASEVGSGGVGFIWSISEAGHEEEWRHSVAPIPADKLDEILRALNAGEIPNTEDNVPLPGSSVTSENCDDDMKDDYRCFEKEVEETFLRGVEENAKEDDIALEVKSLRLSYNFVISDCASSVFYSMMKLAVDMPHGSPSELVKNTATLISKWQKLLKCYLPSIDEEIEVILKFEEISMESIKEYSALFVQILHLLYDKDIIQEEAILKWASEKEGAEEADKVFVKQSEKFIQWLNEASEEEE